MIKIILYCLVFFCLLLPCKSRAGIVLDKVVAVVNNEAITWSELYREMELELGKKTDALNEEQKREILRKSEAAFLEQMIEKELLMQEARRLGISVSSEEVEDAINNIRAKYSMNSDAFYEDILKAGLTIDRYRSLISEQIIIGRLVDREVRGKMEFSAGELDRLMKERKIASGTEYKLRQIFFKFSEGRGESELKSSMEEVKKLLSSGADFAEVAARYSEDQAQGDKGDLGYVRKEQLSDEFIKALEGLSSPGDVSPPFKTRNGVHMIQLEDIRDSKEGLKDVIFEERYGEWLRLLKENAYIDVRL